MTQTHSLTLPPTHRLVTALCHVTHMDTLRNRTTARKLYAATDALSARCGFVLYRLGYAL